MPSKDLTLDPGVVGCKACDLFNHWVESIQRAWASVGLSDFISRVSKSVYSNMQHLSCLSSTLITVFTGSNHQGNLLSIELMEESTGTCGTRSFASSCLWLQCLPGLWDHTYDPDTQRGMGQRFSSSSSKNPVNESCRCNIWRHFNFCSEIHSSTCIRKNYLQLVLG